MALDVLDAPYEEEGIALMYSDRDRADNLLKKSFEDNAAIGLDIAGMVRMGLDTSQIEQVLLDYLGRFGVRIKNLELKKSPGGDVSFQFQFEEKTYV